MLITCRVVPQDLDSASDGRLVLDILSVHGVVFPHQDCRGGCQGPVRLDCVGTRHVSQDHDGHDPTAHEGQDGGLQLPCAGLLGLVVVALEEAFDPHAGGGGAVDLRCDLLQRAHNGQSGVRLCALVVQRGQGHRLGQLALRLGDQVREHHVLGVQPCALEDALLSCIDSGMSTPQVPVAGPPAGQRCHLRVAQ